MEALFCSLMALLLMAIFDGIWLSWGFHALYQPGIGHLLADEMTSGKQLFAAGAFYLLYIAGVSFFVMWPCLVAQSPLASVFLRGAFFGLVAYGTFDLTSQAVMKDWPVWITAIDLVWGSMMTGTISCLSLFFASVGLGFLR